MLEEELIKELDTRTDIARDLVSNLYHNLNELNGTLENIEYLKLLISKLKNNNPN